MSYPSDARNDIENMNYRRVIGYEREVSPKATRIHVLCAREALQAAMQRLDQASLKAPYDLDRDLSRLATEAGEMIAKLDWIEAELEREDG